LSFYCVSWWPIVTCRYKKNYVGKFAFLSN
jgi:hypothetical protein